MNEITDRELELLEDVARDCNEIAPECERHPEDLFERINVKGVAERIVKHIGSFVAITGPTTLLRVFARLRRVEAELEAALKRERVLLHAAWALKHWGDSGPEYGCTGCQRAGRAADWLSTNTTRPTPTTE